MSVVNTCLDSGYTLHHMRMVCVNLEITSFESMELAITNRSITIRLSVIYHMLPVKSNTGLKQGSFCKDFNDFYDQLQYLL